MSRLVLVGGGHVHVAVLASLQEFLRRGHQVTLVSPTLRHYYSGMGPGLLSGAYDAWETRFELQPKVALPGSALVQDRAVSIDPQTRRVTLASGRVLDYDVLSCNVGSLVQGPPTDGSVPMVAVKPIDNLLEARNRLRRARRVGVIGGGPAAVELAGACWRAGQEFGTRPQVTIFAGHGLLAGRPARLARLARASLRRRGVEVIEGQRVVRVEAGAAVLGNGKGHEADLLLAATGVRAQPLFGASNLPTGADGGLLVDQWLRCVEHPRIFGAGDCISFGPGPLDKVGVYAVRQSPVLAHNLLAALEGKDQADMRTFEPGSGYMLILNMGDGRGILWRGPLVVSGRWAYRLKDWIDRAFMRRYQ